MFIIVSNVLFIDIKIQRDMFFSRRKLKKINNQANLTQCFGKSPQDVLQPEEMSFSQVSSGQSCVPVNRFPGVASHQHQSQASSTGKSWASRSWVYVQVFKEKWKCEHRWIRVSGTPIPAAHVPLQPLFRPFPGVQPLHPQRELIPPGLSPVYLPIRFHFFSLALGTDQVLNKSV